MQVSLLLSEPEPVPSLRGAVTSPALGVFLHQHRDLRSLLWSLMVLGWVSGEGLWAMSCWQDRARMVWAVGKCLSSSGSTRWGGQGEWASFGAGKRH